MSSSSISLVLNSSTATATTTSEATAASAPPGTATTTATATAATTSTLLREISTLRQRLKELEDVEDTKSGVSVDHESPLVVMLRKDVAQLELEKANLERDLMNQMNGQANEHALIVQELQSKLTDLEAANQALNDKLIQQQDENRYRRLLQEERNKHQAEMDQMKENLATTDLEITESRREMDHLHEKLDECEVEKEALCEEVSKLRLDYERVQLNATQLQKQLKAAVDREQLQVETLKGKDAVIQQKQNEIAHMNDEIIRLEEHKQMLVQENSDVRRQLHKVENEFMAKLDEEKDTVITHPSTDDESTTTAAAAAAAAAADEKHKHLQETVQQLESKIEQCNSRLSEKDYKIDLLSASLTEERRINKELCDEIKKIKGSSPDTKTTIEKQISMEVNDQVAELNFLRNQNKVLNDEIKNFRRIQQLQQQRGASSPATQQHVVSSSHHPAPSPEPAGHIISRSQSTPPPPPPPPPPPSHPRVTHRETKSHKFSGIVASFERRIAEQHGSGQQPQTPLGTLEHPPLATSASYGYDDSDHHFASVASSSYTAADYFVLQQELQKEQAVVRELQQQLVSETQTVQDLQRQLQQAGNVQDLEGRLQQSQREVERLHLEMAQCEDDKSRLEQKLTQARRHEAAREEEEEKKEGGVYEDEMERLRTQVGALKPELDHALEEIELLEDKVGKLKRALQKAEQQNCNDSSQVGILKAELSKLEMEKVHCEKMLNKRIEELENEIEVIEVAAEEELEAKEAEIDKLKASLDRKEQEIARLEEERTQLCSSMNDVSLSRKDEIDELQAELVEITAKTKAQAREISSYKMEVSELRMKLKEGKGSDALKGRVKELEDEVKVLNHSVANQGDIDALKQENRKLRESMREVKMDRRALQDRLDSLLSDRSSSKSSQVLRDRNSALKQEVEKLTRRLKKMEDSITRFAI